MARSGLGSKYQREWASGKWKRCHDLWPVCGASPEIPGSDFIEEMHEKGEPLERALPGAGSADWPSLLSSPCYWSQSSIRFLYSI
jgi:hypothetical protein